MRTSRLNRYQERILRLRILLGIGGSIVVIIFLIVFGVKILINFSLFMDAIHGTSKDNQPAQSMLLLPPHLDPLPVATNSGDLKVSGNGQPNLTAVIFINDKEVDRADIASTGAFIAQHIHFNDGKNDVQAQVLDDKGNKSTLSNTVSTIISKNQPKLEITSPAVDSTVTGEDAQIIISGKTDENNTVTVNGRLVVVKTDGSFFYQLHPNEGDNQLTIIASDQAGNQTTEQRKVKYQKF